MCPRWWPQTGRLLEAESGRAPHAQRAPNDNPNPELRGRAASGKRKVAPTAPQLATGTRLIYERVASCLIASPENKGTWEVTSRPRPAPQQGGCTPGTPTRAAGEETKGRTEPAGKGVVRRMWAWLGRQGPAPGGREGERQHPDSCHWPSSRFHGDQGVLTNAEKTL